MTRLLVRVISVLLLGFLTVSCGLGVDDATRVERAQEFSDSGEYRAAAIELKNVLRADPANIDARILLGVVALKSGDPASAAKELQRARELGAEPRQYLVPLARALLQVSTADDVLEFSPDDLENPTDRAALNAVLGNAYLRKADLQSARARFDAALADQPGQPEALIGVARILLENQDRAGAEQALRSVIAEQPGSHAAYAVLGRLQLSAAEFAAAEESFRTAVKFADGTPLRQARMSYLAGLVDALLLQGKPGQAQDAAASMLAIAADHPYALFQGARADFESGNFDAAIVKTQQVIAASPDYKPARLLLAAAAMSKENFALAEIHLQTLVNADKDNLQARKLLAQTRMNLGSPEDALAAISPMIAAAGDDARLLTMAGSASLRSGDREAGMDLLERGVRAGSGDPAVQLQAASSFIDIGEFDKAIDILKQMPPEWQTEQYETLLVLALLQSGDVDGARGQAQRYTNTRPSDPAAYRLMGRLQLALKDPDAARVQFEKAVELAPDDVDAVTQLARLDRQKGDLQSAKGRFETLLGILPDNPTALISLAQLAAEEGRGEHALTLMERARESNPTAVQPLLMLSRYYLRAGNDALAQERAETALSVSPENAQALAMLGLVQLETDRYSESLGTLERALKYAPNDTEARFNLARAQLKLGTTEAAIATLKQIVEQDPQHLGANIALTRMQSLRGNHAAALASVVSMKKDYPDRAEPYVLEGDIHIMRGHYNDAIAAYDRAGQLRSEPAIVIKRYDARRLAGRSDSHELLETWLDDHPDDNAIRIVLGQAYQENGLTDNAVSTYQRVLEQQPNNAVALNNLAWLYAERGGADNLARGVEIARQAHDKLPTTGAVTDTYGWLLLQQGKVDEARELLSEAMSQSPDNPDIRYHLAVALQRAGAAQEARDLLDALLSGQSNFDSREDARKLRENL